MLRYETMGMRGSLGMVEVQLWERIKRTRWAVVPGTGMARRSLAGYCLLVLAILSAVSGLQAADAKHAKAKPSVVIPIEPLGYGRPGELYMNLRYSQVSLDFVDADHLLLTFRKKELLRHSTDERADDEDQLIHAVVLKLPDGQVTASADWRMHDRQHYLWPLGPGAFLVRQRDSLFLTNASLELRPYRNFPGRLVAVKVSPDGDRLVVQSEEPQKQAEAQPAKKSPDKAAESPGSGSGKPIVLRVIRVKDAALIATSRGRRAIDLPINSNGFIETLEGKHDQWILSFTPLTGTAADAPPSKPFAELSSTCQPTLAFLTAETVLAMRCTPLIGHLETFLTLDGKLLWEHKGHANGVWPTWTNSRDGSRFAQGTLTEAAASAEPGSARPSEIPKQIVDVFETKSGELLMTAAATPVYDAGQNFALSDDGRRFAILHGGSIEIYDLP